MKTLTLTVELTFEDNLNTVENFADVANNVCEALVHACNTSGIAPEDVDTYTKSISVTLPNTDVKVNHKF